MANPSNDPSVFDEPHLRGAAGGRADCWKCGYDRAGLKPGAACPECGSPEFEAGGVRTVGGQDGAERAEQSVWEEPTLNPALAGGMPEGAETYARWLMKRRAATPLATTWAATVLLAVAAGPWAILGVMCGGMTGEPAAARMSDPTLVGLAGMLIFGPLMEEVLKIAAITWAVERRPYLLASAGQVALCALAGGVAFAVVENLLYLEVYISRPSAEVRMWRWTVCVFLHSACSLIAGLGLMKVWRRTMSRGERPRLDDAYRYLVIAIVIHGAYNALAVFLSWTGRM